MAQEIKKLDWIDSLPADVRAVVRAEMHTLKLNAGQQVYRVGDPNLTIYRIESGYVRMFLLSANGTELLLNIIGPGETFGDLGAIGGTVSATFTIAQTDIELSGLPYQNYLRLRDQYPQIERAQSRLLANTLHRVMLFLQETTSYSLSIRVASRLMWLLQSARAKGDTSMCLKTSQADIAAMIGASRPAVNQVMALFKEQGIIETQYGKTTILNEAQLSYIAADEPH